MKLAIIDDECYQLNILQNILTDTLSEFGVENSSVAAFVSPELFLSGFERGKYDIVILDIYMGKSNGVEIARRVREVDPEVTLAFCTSSNEFASETYEVEAKYYLNKPISHDKVRAMLRRFNLTKIENNRSVALPDGNRVPLRHILYTEYNNHRVTFHIKDSAPRSFYISHGEAETMLLPNKGFSVANKGCIVNLAQVTGMSSGAFLMQNGEQVPISRRRFKEIEKDYMQYRFEKMDAEVSD